MMPGHHVVASVPLEQLRDANLARVVTRWPYSTYSRDPPRPRSTHCVRRDLARARRAATPDFYYINDDRKVRPAGRVQQIWNTLRVRSATGLFFPL